MWKTTAEEAQYSVDNTVQTAIDDRARGAVTQEDKITIQQFGNDSIVGMNATAIPDIKEELRLYIADIEATLDNFNGSVHAREGVVGQEINYAIEEYFKKVKQYLEDLVTNFRAFNDKLTSVEQAYGRFQQAQGGTINDSAAAIKSSEFTEKFADEQQKTS